MKKELISFKDELNNYKKLVDNELAIFFKKQIKESGSIDGSSVEMIKVLEEFTLRGGKRIRAGLTFFGYKCFSKNKTTQDLVRASMANELIQSGLLIHDDIIDRDHLRRGKSTFHKIYEEIGGSCFCLKNNKSEKEHFGLAMAILGGDISLTLGNIILGETKFKNKLDAILVLSRVVRDTTLGQIIDVQSGYDNIFSKEKALKICTLKTAYYSIESPLVLGAVLAGASKNRIKKIRDFAIPMGIAFAIKDDILDIFGDEKSVGKPLGSDLREGKKTFILIKTLELSNNQQRKVIKNILGKSIIVGDDIEIIKEIMLKTGALDFCVNYARTLIDEAKHIIKKQKYNQEGNDFLIKMADYLMSRMY